MPSRESLYFLERYPFLVKLSLRVDDIRRAIADVSGMVQLLKAHLRT